MSKTKHQKFKNTGILFELLVRQITSDTLANKGSVAVNILKKYFRKNTALFKEYTLYQTLMKEKFNNPEKTVHFLDTVLNARKKIKTEVLNKQKYNLIKEIRSHYDINDFVKAKIDNYKTLASICMLFENANEKLEPKTVVESRFTILEHINNKPIKQEAKSSIDTVLTSQDKDVRLLAYKIIIERFNDKYKNLDTNQKAVLSEYINSISNSPKLREFVNAKAIDIKSNLIKLFKKVTDKVTKIKLKEVIHLTETLATAKRVNDNDIVKLLNYYELIKELKYVTK